MVEAPSVELPALTSGKGGPTDCGLDVCDEWTGGVGELADLLGVHVVVTHLEVSLAQLSELVDARAEHGPESAQHQEVAHPTTYLADLPPAQQQAGGFNSEVGFNVVHCHWLILLPLLLPSNKHLAPPCHVSIGVAYHSRIPQGYILREVLTLLVGEFGKLGSAFGIREESSFTFPQQMDVFVLDLPRGVGVGED